MSDYSAVKNDLEAKLKELLERAAEIEGSLSTRGSSDWEEHAKEMEDDEVLAGVGELTKREINEIRLALSRIESGQYGRCTACGGKIPAERLKALPFATTCVNCA